MNRVLSSYTLGLDTLRALSQLHGALAHDAVLRQRLGLGTPETSPESLSTPPTLDAHGLQRSDYERLFRMSPDAADHALKPSHSMFTWYLNRHQDSEFKDTLMTAYSEMHRSNRAALRKALKPPKPSRSDRWRNDVPNKSRVVEAVLRLGLAAIDAAKIDASERFKARGATPPPIDAAERPKARNPKPNPKTPDRSSRKPAI